MPFRHSRDFKEMKETLENLAALLGWGNNNTGHKEKWVSTIGGLLGILAVVIISRQFVGVNDAAWVVASMGATAVLLFAVPHGALSQPWPVVGGQTVAAVIGVACAKWIPDIWFSAAAAVALAIGAMYYLRCIHPPGGATALTAVVGGPGVHELGYQYVLTPVLINTLTIVAIAVVFNLLFPWRRYPAALAARGENQKTVSEAKMPEHESDRVTRGDLQAALKAMNRVIDISEYDLEEIYRLAKRSAQSSTMKPADVSPGCYYSNGHYGHLWQVRQVIDMANPVKTASDLVIYKIVAGHNRRTTGTATIEDFAHWARYQVVLNESSWQRVENADSASEQTPTTVDTGI